MSGQPLYVTSDGPRMRLRVENLEEFDRRLGGLVSRITIDRLIRSGDLDAVTINGERRVVTRYRPTPDGQDPWPESFTNRGVAPSRERGGRGTNAYAQTTNRPDLAQGSERFGERDRSAYLEGEPPGPHNPMQEGRVRG